MTTVTAPLDNLAHRIARQQEELETLRESTRLEKPTWLT